MRGTTYAAWQPSWLNATESTCSGTPPSSSSSTRKTPVGAVAGRVAGCVAVGAEAGAIAGATSVMIDLRNPELGYQHMTGVVREYRGKGFGLWLKSMMYFRLREDYPQRKFVSTDTLSGNIYMQHVNAQLGYAKTVDAKEYRLTRENLEAAVLA